MGFSKAIVFILIIVLTFVLGEKMLRNIFNIGKRDKNRTRFMNKVHMWGEIIIIRVFTASFFYMGLTVPLVLNY